MMNLTSKTSKSFLLFKRAWFLLFLVLCSLVANATGNWSPKVTVNVNYFDEKGKGKVYVTASSSPSLTLTISPSASNPEAAVDLAKTFTITAPERSKENDEGKKYTVSVTMNAVGYPGSKFEGWYNDNDELLTQSTAYTYKPGLAPEDNQDSQKYPGPESASGTFKAKFTAYTYFWKTPSIRAVYKDGASLIIGGGHISINTSAEDQDNHNWVQSISGGEDQSQVGDGYNGYYPLTYYCYAKPLEDYVFVGWYRLSDEVLGQYFELNEDNSFMFKAESISSSDPTNLDFVALFEKRAVYKDLATARVILTDNDGNYTQVDETILGDVGGVFVGRDEGESPTYSIFSTCGNGDKVMFDAQSGEYSYTYYASAYKGYSFIGWSNQEPQESKQVSLLQDKDGHIITESPHTITTFTDNQDHENPEVPTAIYAVFKKNTYYYHTGARAGFATNGEKGQILVTGTVYDKTTGEANASYRKETVDQDIEDQDVYRVEPINTNTYTLTYQAIDTDLEGQDKSVFKGWSRSALGDVIFSTDNPLSYDHVTYSFDPDYPEQPEMLYAVFRSYWYSDPTVLLTTSSAGAGKVAALYTEDETIKPQASDWKDNIQPAPDDMPHQVPALDEYDADGYTYHVCYWAQPNFGAKFAGWADADNPNRLIATNSQNPYKVQYTVKNMDDEDPFCPARLYAVFESVIKVIQKDRMIYYLDENGNENINDSKIIITFDQADILHAELVEDDLNANLFELSDKQRVEVGKSIDLDATSGIMQLVLSYKGKTPKAHVGRTAKIRLSSTYHDGTKEGTAEMVVTVTIEEKPTVSFLHTDGKGAYTIKHTDGRGIGYTMPMNADKHIHVPIAQENMATFELNCTDVQDGLAFSGWEMITKDAVEIISRAQKFTYSFKESASIRPIFTEVRSDLASFSLLTCDGDYYASPQPSYYDLNEVLAIAKERVDKGMGDQIVVFSNDGKVQGTLPQGDYVIPSGVTLLIPGVGPTPIKISGKDDAFLMEKDEDKVVIDGKSANKYVHRINRQVTMNEVAMSAVLTTDDYGVSSISTGGKTPQCYRKLIVEDNTSITVEPGGSINMYTYIVNDFQDAKPLRYGWIELGENSRITLQETPTENSGSAQLYAHGYITGAQSSRVVAQNGAQVYELMQYCENRGGQGLAHLYMQKDNYHTFPIHQYYIQNIEVPLELQFGAIEYVTTSAYVMNTQYVMMAEFIVPDNANKSGFLLLGENTSLVKNYDSSNDRLKIAIEGSNSTAKTGSINIRMGSMVQAIKTAAGTLGSLIPSSALSAFSDISLNSSDYVMPINNNIDLALHGVNFSTSYDVAFMAGSTLHVDKSSSFTIQDGAEVFVYDANQNRLPASERSSEYGAGSGYYGAGNYSLCPITYLPNSGVQQSSTDPTVNKLRKAQDITDATWIIDGVVTVANGGGFYTTEGKANIISNDKGQVVFNSGLSSTTTYQAKYNSSANSLGFLSEDGTHKKIGYKAYSAQLKNVKKDTEGNDTYTDTQNQIGTYTFNPAKGIWEKVSDVTEILTGAKIAVTLPDYNTSTPETDPLVTTITTNLSGVKNATISWDNGNSWTPIDVERDSYGDIWMTLSYKPTNKKGEYEGLIRINDAGDYYQRLIVTEDYTPEFEVPEQLEISAYLGYSQDAVTNIQPVSNNVASILDGQSYANSVDWTYTILGENADEFAFNFGTGVDKLSGAKVTFTPKTANSKSAVLSLTCTYTDGTPIEQSTTMAIKLVGKVNTLTPNPLAFADGVESMFVGAEATRLFADVANGNTKPIVVRPQTSEYYTLAGENMSTTIKPDKVGTVTITATQDVDEDNGVAATTITKTITITDNIVWNWENLYFGSENVNPIATLYTDWNLEVKDNHLNVIREFNSLSAEEGTYQVILESWPDGEAEPVFTMTYNDGTGDKTQDFISHVTRDPRHLSVYINEDRVYEAVTLNVSHINSIASTSGDDYYVKFNSTEDEIAQWTFHFMGIPDKLSFNASGSNNWQIEESANGANWTIAYTWAKISSSTEFELSLQPSTNYVRISYGTNGSESTGVLSKIAITELLSVKSDVEKLYMPILNPSSQKNVVFTYVSENDLALSTNKKDDNGNFIFTTSPDQLTGSSSYQITRVAVNSTATTEIKDGMLSVLGSSAAVPIRTYEYPQELPIQLASDELERYYFVTSESYNTTWSNDEATRTIVMRNAVADASPYIVFHFADAPAPGVISFNYAGISDGASWTVQESEDGTVWYDLEVDTDNEKDGLVMRKFLRSDKSRYVSVIYNSDYAGIVDVTNMAILPTTSVVVNPAQLTVFSDQPEELSVIASNLQDVQFTFTPSEAFSISKVMDKEGVVQDNGIQYFQDAGAHNGKVLISYDADAAVTYGKLEITTNYAANGDELSNPEVLATVELTGINRYLPKGETGIYTGTSLKITNFKKEKEGDEGYRREVNTTYAFDKSETPLPLFDYVIIYGETKTTDGSPTITAPSSVTGSNAQTPCYIYKKALVDTEYKYVIEDESYIVENANSSRKSWRGAISIADTDPTLGVADPTPENLRVYITGFCPYASTGYTQSDEGVWYFEGDAGDKIDIYLEDCYIYSRYKSKRGNSFTRESGESYSGMVARGSGAVLLFANKIQKDGLTTSLDVTIHTRESNVLKSHYGCLFSSFVGRAFQISAPIQIYMQSENHYKNSYATLTFDDKWPTDATDYSKFNRTNGFLSLQKQVNNAPSIDMGNEHTVVNFCGGHIELQNACISSDNYESSLAISYRTGVYGPSKFRFVLSYGIGTDGVDGTVNFYDGTTTVKRMEVPERFRQYYLMDEDGKNTSCLRSQKNTFVYGGSHCMMRACEAPTSKGGAPTDGVSALGKYEYTADKEWSANTTETENATDCRLVTPTAFPNDCFKGYYTKYTYGLKSVTPVDGKLNLWIPDLDCPEFEVKPEVDQKISFWKASMTRIEASYGVYSGDVGGDFSVEMEDGNQVEQVQNLLYCQIDQNISDVIRENTGENKYVAPVLNPAPDGGYISIAPTSVGEDVQHYIGNEEPYRVEDKVYYVTTIPQADVWINFTAPFNVEKIYVVETYDEEDLSKSGTRDDVMKEQAKHNADFAAFFGVAIALESKKTFNLIYQDYLGWVREQDDGRTDKRGMLELEHYYETKDAEGKFNSNWKTADYYLYKNTGNWTLNASGKLDTKWNFVTTKEGTKQNILLKQGETYSMLFPYCTGCWDYDELSDIYTRDYWDYWSGKFLIFESTDGPHTIQGSNYINAADDPDGNKQGDWAFEVAPDNNEVKLMGNNTFAKFSTNNSSISSYAASPMQENYTPIGKNEEEILPTASFLYGNMSKDGIRPRIMRDGSLRYDNQNTTTGGKVPTVGGGNDMFITAIDGGINIAVAEPQMVRVLSSTGSVIFAGTITTATDVLLPTSGIYIISGENEVQKVLH